MNKKSRLSALSKLSAVAICTILVLTLALMSASLLAPTALAEGVTLSVPAGVEVPSMTGSTLPTANTPGDEYTFVGWAEAPIDTDTTVCPTVFKAGDEYSGTATLYAVYSYGTGYTLMTSESAPLKEGDKIIIAASGYDYAVSTTQNNNNRGQAAITKISSTVTPGIDTQILTVGTGTVTGTFAFYTGSGYLYAASSSSNNLKTQATLNENGSWKVTINEGGIAGIVAQGTYTRNTMRYNSSSSLFSCYAETNTQKDICIYRYDPKYYTNASCSHESTTTETVEATCTAPGSVTVTCNSCETVVSTETVPALGHTDGASEVTDNPTCQEEGVRTYNCSVCGEISRTEAIDKVDHSYVDGACTMCRRLDPTTVDYSGRYAIAAKRTNDDAYHFMTGALTGTSTNRYAVEEISAYKSAPSSITEGVSSVFVLIKNSDNETYKIYTESATDDAKYLGWTSGNSGALVTEDAALNVSVDRLENGLFNIYFESTVEGEIRYLAYNNTATNKYAAWYKDGQAQDLSLIPVVPARFSAATVSLGADLTMKYTVSLAEGEDIDNYSARFTMNGKTVTVTDYISSGENYVFTFTGIAPQYAGDNIKAELLKSGTVIDIKDNYSVLANVTSLLGKEDTTEEQKTLIADLLNYCAAAQEYTGYKTDAPVNADLTVTGSDATPTDSDNIRSATASTNNGIYCTAAGVRFDSINQIYVKFKAPSLEGVAVTVNSEAAKIVSLGGGVYAVYSSGISAKNFATEVVFELLVNGETVQTVTYSINSYAFAKCGGETVMGKLALALYRYGVSAANYNG
ncbi:MAG: hypothetical protein IJW48_03550 [Clostridia bacterium]|nr:hypothetical protein [Clostridia bacterium]